MLASRSRIFWLVCIFFSISLSGCYKDPHPKHFQPISETLLSNGKYILTSKRSSTFKSWTKLADYVARKLSKKAELFPYIKSKSIYIIPGKDSPFERTYRLLLTHSLSNYGFVVSASPRDAFIMKYNSVTVEDNREVIVETYLYDNEKVLFSDSSTIYVMYDKDFYNYFIKLPQKQLKKQERIYHIVDK